MALVVFLLELRNPVAMRRQLRRVAQDQRRVEIGFDDVFRRRQDVGDQIVAELELVVERAADLELGKSVNAGSDHGAEAAAVTNRKIKIAREMLGAASWQCTPCA